MSNRILSQAVRRAGALTFVGALGLCSTFSSGCIALKADQDDLAAEVDKLRKEVLAQDQQSEQTITKAEKLTEELESKIAQLEEVLRRNQADLGLRVDNLETDTQQLRGAAENADFVATAAKQELTELRGDVDVRLLALEEKLNEATNIPESKKELWAEAEKQFKAKNYKASRRLWRTYESRYPSDEKIADVRFNIGLTFFSAREYRQALGEFYRVIQETPKASVIPDALYYSGLAFAKLGQCQNAIAYFNALRQKKTKAPAHYKTKAKEQIDILEKDGGDICTDGKKPADAS
ncbi:MAG: tetratricopeptide repeat protein [Myxococcota bacterium]